MRNEVPLGSVGADRIASLSREIPTDDAERRRFFERVTSEEYKPKLGGWPVLKFAAAGAQLRLRCRECGYSSQALGPAEFTLTHTRQHDGTKLIVVKRMCICPKCNAKGGRRLVISIAIGSRVIDY